MTTNGVLPAYLSDLRERVCRRCFEPIPEEAPRPHRARAAGDGPAANPLGVSREEMCGRCLFLLLLEVINELVPAEETPAWMEQPSHVLGGRTPRECIDAGDYEGVFEALWLLNPSAGPVS